MHRGANVDVQAEADTQFPLLNVSDDELERAASGSQQAVTWEYCTQYSICPF
jgi:hypothetical protein